MWELVQQLDANAEPFDITPQIAEAVDTGQPVENEPDQTGGDHIVVSAPPVTVPFSQAQAALVTKDHINACALRLGYDVPKSGSKALQLAKFSQAAPHMTAEEIIDLIASVTP